MFESTAKTFFTTKGTKEHEVFFKQLCAGIQDSQLSLSEILCVLRVLCGSRPFCRRVIINFDNVTLSSNCHNESVHCDKAISWQTGFAVAIARGDKKHSVFNTNFLSEIVKSIVQSIFLSRATP